MKNLPIIKMSDVQVEEINWLIYPLIPYGKVTIIQGDPGEGKTTLVLHIIASLTKGETISLDSLTDNSHQNSTTPINVIYQTAEDGLGDTIKPRLLEAGADCSRVLVIDDRDSPLTMLDQRIEQALQITNAKLIVLDPIQGFLGSKIDMHRANEIRPVMKRLSDLAEKYHCAIILIGHMNKCSSNKSSYRGLGSIDFQAAARSVLVVGRVKDEPEIRVVCQIKSSLAPEAAPIAFKLSEANGFQWLGKYDISVDDLLSGASKVSKKQYAMEFLIDLLSSNDMLPSVEVLKLATEKGIAKRTLEAAKKDSKIKSTRKDNKWHMYMSLE